MLLQIFGTALAIVGAVLAILEFPAQSRDWAYTAGCLLTVLGLVIVIVSYAT
jgi:uncharacterized membrane protein HdeD (DUF308 family)